MVECDFCMKSFARKDSFKRHLSTNSCTNVPSSNQLEWYKYIKKNYPQNKNTGPTLNLTINIQPLNVFTLKDTDNDLIYEFIQNYDQKGKKINNGKRDAIISYFNKTLPDKNLIKYISKRPLQYQIAEKQDENGDVINSIRGLKDSVNILTDPILKALKSKILNFENKLRKENDKAVINGTEDELKYDYPLVEDTIIEIKKELDRDVVQKTLKQFLRNDVLNDINMKLNIH